MAAALAASEIETRRYYHPPVHRMKAYAHLTGPVADLPETERAARQALTLPLWNSITIEDVDRVGRAIEAARP